MVPVRRNARNRRAYLAGGGLVLSLIFSSIPLENSGAETQTPPVQTEHKTDGTISYDKNTTPDKRVEQPPPTSATGTTYQNKAEERPEEGAEKASEFWPAFYGYRLKVTDSLLVCFTFILTVFTGGLWFSTHRLWRSGEKQIAASVTGAQSSKVAADAAMAAVARPYLHIIGMGLLDFAGSPAGVLGDIYVTAIVTLAFKNIGKAPATIVGINIRIAVGEDSRTDFSLTRDNSAFQMRDVMALATQEIGKVQGLLNFAVRIGPTIPKWSDLHYYLVGAVDYIDPISASRRTRGFLFKLSSMHKIATAVTDPAYDYDRKRDDSDVSHDHLNLTFPN